jgi:hypothetical protein
MDNVIKKKSESGRPRTRSNQKQQHHQQQHLEEIVDCLCYHQHLLWVHSHQQIHKKRNKQKKVNFF